jgi:hypothetical protein
MPWIGVSRHPVAPQTQPLQLQRSGVSGYLFTRAESRVSRSKMNRQRSNNALGFYQRPAEERW